MKNIKCLFLLFLFFISLNVKAIDSCTTDEMKRLKELANNVEIKYEYEIANEYKAESEDEQDYVKIMYKLKVFNFNEDLRFVLAYDNEQLDVKNASELENFDFYEGDKITIKIYSYTINNCINKLLKSEKIEFPYYNQYYYRHKDFCQSHSDFEYCEEFLKKTNELSDEEIDKLFQKEDKIETNDNPILKKNNYLLIMIIALIAFILIVIITIIKKRKKNKL